MNGELVRQLIGRWSVDPNDIEAQQAYGKTSLEFAENGSLIYIIHGELKVQKMFLTYKVQDRMIITNQASDPREEKSPFYFTPEGDLIIMFGRLKTRYIRNS